MSIESSNINKKAFELSRPLIFLMAVTSGITVANLYYIQPLLAELAKTFNVSQAIIGIAAMLVQIGYALGLFLFVPLGDIKERRSLIITMLACATCALFLMSVSLNIWMLSLSSLLVGTTSIVPMLIVPLAAHLSMPSSRGKVVGTIMGGLLIGILLSRTFSGIIGEALGWRAVYRIAAFMMLFLIILLRIYLPKSPADYDISYGQLLKSLWGLFRDIPVLREASFNGAMMFGTFSAFWTTLVFLLRTPYYNMGTREAGMFGLVGVSGALAASVVGRITDKRSPRLTLNVAIALSILSYAFFWFFGLRLWGLIVGVILLDLGTQSAHISNQARIFALGGEVRNRVNAIYMVSYFIGGASGSILASTGWGIFQWKGVCAVGLLLQLAAVIVHYVNHPKPQRSTPS